MKDNERKLLLVKEALKDWRAGKLSDTAFAYAVSAVVEPPRLTRQDSAMAIKFAKRVVSESRERMNKLSQEERNELEKYARSKMQKKYKSTRSDR